MLYLRIYILYSVILLLHYTTKVNILLFTPPHLFAVLHNVYTLWLWFKLQFPWALATRECGHHSAPLSVSGFLNSCTWTQSHTMPKTPFCTHSLTVWFCEAMLSAAATAKPYYCGWLVFLFVFLLFDDCLFCSVRASVLTLTCFGF